MKVRVHFYAQLRDITGNETFDTDVTDGATIADLLRKTYQQFPALGAHDKTILVGAGVEFVGRDYRIQPDETIAIMPPVQGG